jgi:hypothetical protein
MTNQEDRISKLDDLFDAACEKLSESPVEPEAGKITPEVVELATVMLQHYTGIIDRWLQVREADRQYALQQKPKDIHNVDIDHVCERCGVIRS